MDSPAGGKFELKKLIGEGAFGKVFLLENPEGEQLALKLCELLGRHPKEIMQTIQEVQLLAQLKHEHILRYVEASQEGGKLFIVTEYCANGDLKCFLEEHGGTPMDERRLVEWIRQITEALKYLHGLPKPVIHRDIKAANIFFDKNWNTKLGDFGIARVRQSVADLAETQCGTPMYMSPEVFAGIPYTDKTDIYSLGIMMYEMANMDKELILPQILLFKIVQHSAILMPTGYSQGVVDLLLAMIQKDPRQRPSAADILTRDVFRNTQKPPPLAPRGEPDLQDVETEDRADKDMQTIIDTLTQMDLYEETTLHVGGAARLLHDIEEGQMDFGSASGDTGEYEDNPVMQLVTRTLNAMGHNTTQMLQGRSSLERQMELLKMYCLQCLDNNKALFKSACDALDKSLSEEEIEETLIKIMGHEKYGLCGVQLLHYKNFVYNLAR